MAWTRTVGQLTREQLERLAMEREQAHEAFAQSPHGMALAALIAEQRRTTAALDRIATVLEREQALIDQAGAAADELAAGRAEPGAAQGEAVTKWPAQKAAV